MFAQCRYCYGSNWINLDNKGMDGRCMHCGLSDAHKHTQKGTGDAVLPYVIADLQARANLGERRYGVPLNAFNGRSPLSDAYTELMDGAQYLRQWMLEHNPPSHHPLVQMYERHIGDLLVLAFHVQEQGIVTRDLKHPSCNDGNNGA
jgi:hypothetical protein